MNLLTVLEERFRSHMHRHQNITWEEVVRSIDDALLAKLQIMEDSGGEPDVIYGDEKSFTFCDCSEQTPARRSFCYDQEALDKRKHNKPEDSALAFCERHGLSLCDLETYQLLQTHEDFDTKTSFWILTPPSIRKLGGAMFADKRYGVVWNYHNGADSYYSSRGFRCLLQVPRS